VPTLTMAKNDSTDHLRSSHRMLGRRNGETQRIRGGPFKPARSTAEDVGSSCCADPPDDRPGARGRRLVPPKGSWSPVRGVPGRPFGRRSVYCAQGKSQTLDVLY